MKKQLLPLFLLFIGALASCSAPSRSGEKAAQQLVNYFIYQEKTATFSQTFREPKVLAEHLQTSRQQFQKQFFNSLKEMNAEVTETEAQKLSAELLAQVKKKASYQLVATKELNGQATITFQIKGLDFVTAIEDTTTALLQQTQQATQALDMQHTLAVLKKEIQQINVSHEPVELPLTVKQVEGQWYLPAAEQLRLNQFFLAFVTGKEDTDQLTEALDTILTQAEQKVVTADEKTAISGN